MVKFIKYKGKEYPVRLSYRVIKQLKSQINSEEDVQKLSSLDPEMVETMLWHGLISGHKFTEKELTLKKEDMEDVLDECFFEFLKLIPEFFPKAKLGNGLPNLELEKESSNEDQEQQADQTT